ncbi:hypothetical protein [Neorhizobium sp. P12A]|uniref:hypothetical protein n=1 Tax=Neorhizobium sp. P12A TaxID=2268027 RepID=UPI0011F05FCC|nr:hypothetical protein [Neorhizobium sp. P12A]
MMSARSHWQKHFVNRTLGLEIDIFYNRRNFSFAEQQEDYFEDHPFGIYDTVGRHPAPQYVRRPINEDPRRTPSMLLVSFRGSRAHLTEVGWGMSTRLRYLMLAFTFSIAIWAGIIVIGVRLVGNSAPGIDSGNVASTRPENSSPP